MNTTTAVLLTLALILGLALVFVIWKARYTRAVRLDAIQRSQAVTAGRMFEQLVPYLPDFPFDPRDVRFLGSPVDFVIFEGLSGGGDVARVVFVEVKTGSADLSGRERRVRDAVRDGRVAWHELRVAPGGAEREA